MIRFLFGVIVGVILCFLFLYFGGGRTVKKVGEGLIDTGKKMEALESEVKRGKEDPGDINKKKHSKEERESPRRGQ
jgi:hypothetical protein